MELLVQTTLLDPLNAHAHACMHYMHALQYMQYMHYMHYMHDMHDMHDMHYIHYVHYIHYISIHPSIHTYIHPYIHTSIHTYIVNIYICICKCLILLHTNRKEPRGQGLVQWLDNGEINSGCSLRPPDLPEATCAVGCQVVEFVSC